MNQFYSIWKGACTSIAQDVVVGVRGMAPMAELELEGIGARRC
jgi:hypothetical protein